MRPRHRGGGGCAAPGGDPCRDDQFCGVIVNLGTYDVYWYAAEGICVDLSTVCTPDPG